MQIITIPDLNDSMVRIILDNTLYWLHFSWNSRGFWSMGIYDKDSTAVVEGIKLVPNFPLTLQYRRPQLPAGEFLVTVQDDRTDTLGREDFKNMKAALVYVTAGELHEL